MIKLTFLNEFMLIKQAIHYWDFLHKGFKFQPDVCNGGHDLLMMSMNLSDIAILKFKSAIYHCILSRISKT